MRAGRDVVLKTRSLFTIQALTPVAVQALTPVAAIVAAGLTGWVVFFHMMIAEKRTRQMQVLRQAVGSTDVAVFTVRPDEVTP